MGLVNQVFVEPVVWVVRGWLYTGECIRDHVVFAGHMLDVCCGFSDRGQLACLVAGNGLETLQRVVGICLWSVKMVKDLPSRK